MIVAPAWQFSRKKGDDFSRHFAKNDARIASSRSDFDQKRTKSGQNLDVIDGRKPESARSCMAAMQNAALHNKLESRYLAVWEEQLGAKSMGFRTEFFSRPRPKEDRRFRAALEMLTSMSNADLADIGIKPADFPRLAREMATK